MGRQAATKKAAAPAADPEPEAPSTYTISNVERILQEVQMPAAPIRSSVVAMLKAQRAMGDEFVPRFCLQVNRILCVKKKEPAIEKVIKFMTAYCRHLSEKGTVEEQDFTEGLLMYLMRGVAVKDKAVRFRCTQMVALIMNELTEITDDLWQELQRTFLLRVRDRDASIRAQAVCALAKMQDDNAGVMEGFVELLSNDPSGDVRKCVLANIQLCDVTLDAVVERRRDTDARVRRFLFKGVLVAIDPGVLSIEHREQLLQSGLNDEDEQVRKACGETIAHWTKALGGPIEMLLRLDVLGNPSLCSLTLSSFFSTTKSFSLIIDDTFLSTLTPESALLARCFAQHYPGADDLVELSTVCKYIQERANAAAEVAARIGSLDVDEEEEERVEEEAAVNDFVLEQLMLLAKHLDHSDEAGRRRLVAVLRALLADPDTPEPLVSIMIDVLFVLAVSETDFIRLVSEIISDIRDNAAAIGPSSTNSNTAMSHVPAELSPTERKQLEMHVARLKVQLHQLHERQRLAVDQEDFAAASAAKADKDGVEAQMKEISARLVPIGQVGGGGGHVVEVSVVGPQRDSAFTVAKALLLAKEIFMRVNQPLRENPTLLSVLADNVFPRLNSPSPPLCQAAWQALGLACLLDVDLARQHSPRLIALSLDGQVPEGLSLIGARAFFDCLMVHGTAPCDSDAEKKDGGEIAAGHVVALLRHVAAIESPVLVHVAVRGACKLLLLGLVPEARQGEVGAALKAAVGDGHVIKAVMAALPGVIPGEESAGRARPTRRAAANVHVVEEDEEEEEEEEEEVANEDEDSNDVANEDEPNVANEEEEEEEKPKKRSSRGASVVVSKTTTRPRRKADVIEEEEEEEEEEEKPRARRGRAAVAGKVAGKGRKKEVANVDEAD